MRRRGREAAVQLLYQMDLRGDLAARADAEPALDAYFGCFDSKDGVDREFVARLVRGVVAELLTVDEAITSASENWRLERMDRVDRNVMRLAVYEMLYCPDVPKLAAVNEALEIARRFGGDASVAFVNGILDQVAKHGEGQSA